MRPRVKSLKCFRHGLANQVRPLLNSPLPSTTSTLTWVANLANPGSSRSRPWPRSRGDTRLGRRALEPNVREEKSHGHSSAANLGLGSHRTGAAPLRPASAGGVLG